MVSIVLISGAGLLAAKAFTELHLEAERPAYTLAAYGAATVLSLFAVPLRSRLASPAPGTVAVALALGAITGLFNVGQLIALLRGLAEIPGIIAFPVTAAGGLLAVTIGGRILWHERLAGRAGIGIALSLAAVALVNL
jgi:multidrug transporter EmrE-like cation transporter